MNTYLVIGIVVVVAIIAIAVWMMTRTSSPSPSASMGGGGGGLWSNILGIGGSAIAGAGGIIDQQTAQQHSDPQTSNLLTEQWQ